MRGGLVYRQWELIGSSPWLVRQLRFGIQIPWVKDPPYRRPRAFELSPKEACFAEEEIRRWMMLGFSRRATVIEERRLRKRGQISPAFVTNMQSKPRLVIDYKRVNDCLEHRTFRMDQLSDLVPVLTEGDSLFKADIKDAYYHLRSRASDSERLAFQVGGRILPPLCMNCGLTSASWFFTKAMRPVVAELRNRGHRVFSYLDDFFGAANPTAGRASPSDIRALGMEILVLFGKLGLGVHPKKCNFRGRPP